MSKGNGAKPSQVGYGKPPKASQWKPGQSGNPSGKKKAAPKPVLLEQAITNELAKLVTIKSEGKTIQVTMAEVIAKKMMMKAVDADGAKLTALVKLLLALETTGKKQGAQGQSDDQEEPMFTEYHRRLLEIARRDAGME